MIQILRNIWTRVAGFLFPQDYLSWQTPMYLGLFSFLMSWIARLSPTLAVTETFIATGGWLFFAIGVGWFLEANTVHPFGIPLSPWASGIIVCAYFFSFFPRQLPLALTVWPLVSVVIAAIPQFLNWELKPRIPKPGIRQQLILMLLVALLMSNWFQFYFRLQTWFDRYPSLLADSFGNSSFVYRLGSEPREQSQGVALLTSVEREVKTNLNDTPWPYVERWLLNLNDQLEKLETQAGDALEGTLEENLWQLRARPRSVEGDAYALDLLAVWSGPASNPEGYYYEKTCVIRPRSQTQPRSEDDRPNPTTQMAAVDCELPTPKQTGRPDLTPS